MAQDVRLYSTRLLSGTTFRVRGIVDGVNQTVTADLGTVTPTIQQAIEALNRSDVSLVADVQLTNAQFKALRATPKVLIAAPGAGKLILVDEIYIVVDAAAGAYTESADNLALQYTTSGTDILTIETTGFIDGAAITTARKKVAIAQDALIDEANKSVELFNNGDGEIGGGHASNTVSVKVRYSIVDVVAFS